MASIERTTSAWFKHEEAGSKREEVAKVILQAAEAARLEEKPVISLGAGDKLEMEEPNLSSTSINGMKLKELEAALKSRGLSKSGRKSDLQKRLLASLEAEDQSQPASQSLPLKRKFLSGTVPRKKKKVE